MGLTWDGQYLWTAPWHEAGKLYRFDVSGNTVKILQTPVGFRSGLAWDKGCLWVSSNGPDCKIYEIDPSDGHIIRVITGPAVRTFDMTWQGSDLWAVDWVAELGKDSRVFKIQVLEKATSSISIMVSTNQINKGESISISGSISPAVSGATVYLAYMKAGEVKVEKIVTTKSDGSFFHSYMPDAGGSWSVEARWEGNEQYQEAMSSPVNFECVDKGCIIATSTYGSELASEVQFLRSFREKTVYSTFAGASFMEVFNAFYYSWSPIVAAQIWKSETLKALGRVLITPLLSILHISTTVNSVFSFNPELAIVLTGLVASSLIGVVYFTPITVGALYAFKKKGNTLPKIGKLKFLFIPWITSLILIYLGEVIWSNVLLMIATGATIVFTIALTAAVLALKITRKLP